MGAKRLPKGLQNGAKIEEKSGLKDSPKKTKKNDVFFRSRTWKIELPLQRELNSQGPRPFAKQQKNDFFQYPLWERSWDPPWSISFPSWLHFGSLWAPRWPPKTPLKNTLKITHTKAPQTTQNRPDRPLARHGGDHNRPTRPKMLPQKHPKTTKTDRTKT